MEKLYIGIDVGGMSIKGGIVTTNGKILYKSSKKTDAKLGMGTFLKDIKTLILELLENAKKLKTSVKAIGFGIPGVVNTKKGTIDFATNLYMENVPIAEYLKDLKLPVYLSNDANVACLGEAKFGAAKGYKNVVLLTLGTGIGGGLILDGKLFEGNEGKGAELGHAVIVTDGISCSCGRKGCFERYASASALLKYTKEEMLNNKQSMMWDFAKGDIENVDGLTSFECAKKGDMSANFVVDKYIKYLGEGVLNYCNIFRPEIILLGGGVSNQGSYLIDKVTKYCADRNYGYKGTPKVIIDCASLKNDAGIVGAAALAMERESN
ncbi:MAG: ROK family protein [Erysipelotrichaceae bacterium]|jgi:glucokinase|nr:ROK family protein [Erysipelotrichaceae bacterium]MCB9499818.1 ROK family protein [Erysipelotrichaceae bacterium]